MKFNIIAGVLALTALVAVEAVDHNKLGAHVAHVKKHQHEKAHHKSQHKTQHSSKKHKQEEDKSEQEDKKEKKEKKEKDDEEDFTNKKMTPGGSCGSFSDCDACSEASLVCIWCPATNKCLEQRKAAILGLCKGATHKCGVTVEESEAEPYQPEHPAIVTPVRWTVVNHDDEHSAEVPLSTGIVAEAEEVGELPPPYWIRAPANTADAISQAEAAVAQVSNGIVSNEQKEEITEAIEEAVASGVPLEQAVESAVKQELPNPDDAVNAIHAAQEAQTLAAQYIQVAPEDEPVTDDLVSKAIAVAEQAALSVTATTALTEDQRSRIHDTINFELGAGTAPTQAVHRAVAAVIDLIEENKTNEAINQAIATTEATSGKTLSPEAREKLATAIRESVSEGSTHEEAIDEAIAQHGGEELNALAQSVAEYEADYVADQYQSEIEKVAESAATVVAESAAVQAAEEAAAQGATTVEIAQAAAQAAAAAAAEKAAEVTVTEVENNVDVLAPPTPEIAESDLAQPESVQSEFAQPEQPLA